jgi:hypothetical protein
MVAVSNGAVITIKYTTGPMKWLFTNGTKVPSFKRCIGADALITYCTLRHHFCEGKKLTRYLIFFAVLSSSGHRQDCWTQDETKASPVLSMP